MVLPTALASINQAAVAAARAGRHEEALQLYAQLFQQLQGMPHPSRNLRHKPCGPDALSLPLHTERHLGHPQLFVTHSNKAASHLALEQYTAALEVRGSEGISLPATPALRLAT